MSSSTRKSPRILKARAKLGKKIEELIRKDYPSVENFALSNGMNKSMVLNILKGTSDPQFSTLIRLAEALEVPLVQLVDGVFP